MKPAPTVDTVMSMGAHVQATGLMRSSAMNPGNLSGYQRKMQVPVLATALVPVLLLPSVKHNRQHPSPPLLPRSKHARLKRRH